jgi:hypothetical protein
MDHAVTTIASALEEPEFAAWLAAIHGARILGIGFGASELVNGGQTHQLPKIGNGVRTPN